MGPDAPMSFVGVDLQFRLRVRPMQIRSSRVTYVYIWHDSFERHICLPRKSDDLVFI